MFGEIKLFVGLQIKQKKDGIYITQSKYIKEILKKFGMEDSRPVGTPMSTRHKLTKNEDAKRSRSDHIQINDQKIVVCSAYKA